jgi:hypothetical protein
LIALADLEALFFFLSLTTCSMILVCHSKIWSAIYSRFDSDCLQD